MVSVTTDTLAIMLDQVEAIVNARLAALKGDFAGHPFRGNQYTEGGGSGSSGNGDEGGDSFQGSDETRYGSNSPPDDFNKEWRDGLTGDEVSAIQGYTLGGYKSLNESLREGRPLSIADKHMADNLDRAIESSPEFDSPKIVYRGVNIGDNVVSSHGAEMIGMNESERSTATRKYIADYAESTFKPGSVIESRGFQSTSFNVDPALDASLSKKSPGIIFEIAAKKGAFLNGVSKYDDENELLLSRKTKYRIVKVIRSAKFSRMDSDVERTVIQVEQMQ